MEYKARDQEKFFNPVRLYVVRVPTKDTYHPFNWAVIRFNWLTRQVEDSLTYYSPSLSTMIKTVNGIGIWQSNVKAGDLTCWYGELMEVAPDSGWVREDFRQRFTAVTAAQVVAQNYRLAFNSRQDVGQSIEDFAHGPRQECLCGERLVTRSWDNRNGLCNRCKIALEAGYSLLDSGSQPGKLAKDIVTRLHGQGYLGGIDPISFRAAQVVAQKVINESGKYAHIHLKIK